jgi:hypothetical protein
MLSFAESAACIRNVFSHTGLIFAVLVLVAKYFVSSVSKSVQIFSSAGANNYIIFALLLLKTTYPDYAL